MKNILDNRRGFYQNCFYGNFGGHHSSRNRFYCFCCRKNKTVAGLKRYYFVPEQMQKIRATNLHLRVDEGKGKDEISKLAYSFNHLLEHLENAFEMQKTYIANASHELRIPVTSMIGKIEVALYHPHSEAEYRLLLKSILQDSTRLQETISSFMELAQVDADYTLAEKENVRVDDLIWQLQNHWNRQGKGQLQVLMQQLPEDENRLVLSLNRQLLVIALNNVIGKAFKFSADQTVKLFSGPMTGR